MENSTPIPPLPNVEPAGKPQAKFSPAVRVLILLCAAMVGLIAVSFITMAYTLANPEAIMQNIKSITLFQDVFVFILPALGAMALCFSRPLRQMCLTSAPSWRALALVVVVWAVSLPAMNWLVEWNKGWWLPSWLEWMRKAEADAAALTEKMLNFKSVGELLSSLFVVAFMAGLSEEMFFRGAMQRMLSHDSRREVLWIWVVAVVFSAIHMQFLGFVPRLLLGAWFGYLLVWTRSLWVPIIAHMLNNATVVVASWLGNIGVLDVEAVDRIGIPESGFPWLAAASAITTSVIIWGAFKNRRFAVEKQKIG